MGGPAGSGGSDRSDEKKVDTYSDQLKKEQARKSKFKKDKFGYTVKKNIVERIVDNHPGIQAVKNIGDKMNLNRRMKFANKLTEQGKDINIQGMSTEQILSKDFKAKLDSYGYTRKDPRTGANTNRDSDNQKSAEQPKVASQMDNTEVKSKLITADKTAPTTVEMANAELTDDERKLKVKRGKKTKTVLTDITGLKDQPTLSKKILLG